MEHQNTIIFQRFELTVTTGSNINDPSVVLTPLLESVVTTWVEILYPQSSTTS